MLPNPEETAGLVTFAEEILNGKLYFLCSVTSEDSQHLNAPKRCYLDLQPES